MSLPINLPPRVVKDMAVTAVWANSIREAIARLANRRISNNRGGGSGGGGGEYVPWAANFTTEGTVEIPVYKVRFNLGTLNNVAAANWDEVHTLADDDTVRFVVLTITSASGKVTGLTIGIQSTIIGEDEMSKDTPPTTHKILLGAISKTSAVMIEDTNLNAVAVEVFRESKAITGEGEEPFSRWWRWAHTQV